MSNNHYVNVILQHTSCSKEQAKLLANDYEKNGIVGHDDPNFENRFYDQLGRHGISFRKRDLDSSLKEMHKNLIHPETFKKVCDLWTKGRHCFTIHELRSEEYGNKAHCGDSPCSCKPNEEAEDKFNDFVDQLESNINRAEEDSWNVLSLDVKEASDLLKTLKIIKILIN